MTHPIVKPIRSVPYVLVTLAMTADGKIATANRRIHSFTSARDHAHLLERRATADAVLCAATTVNGEGITLGTGGTRYQRLRRRRGLTEHALRVVVSGRANLRPDADVFRDRLSPVIVLVSGSAPPARVERLRRVADEVRVFGTRDVDLPGALIWLRKDWNVKRIACEGGAKLNDAMFRAGLVDELNLTISPRIFGGADAPTLADGSGVPRLAMAARLELIRVRRVDDELFLTYRAADR